MTKIRSCVCLPAAEQRETGDKAAFVLIRIIKTENTLSPQAFRRLACSIEMMKMCDHFRSINF